ncbi:hypothetical protein FQN53_002521 [Emmonsiellopsis sp. PD_33]|nr:hypothetical protein FQN53_002521 [Emmonsiellopsis sp. PD_33]
MLYVQNIPAKEAQQALATPVCPQFLLGRAQAGIERSWRWQSMRRRVKIGVLESEQYSLPAISSQNRDQRLNNDQAFLLHRNLDTPSWPAQISDSRAAYVSLREHFLKYIHHPDDLPSTADPLAEDDESPWQTLRRDESIRAEIYQDVERCMQENYFFREPTTKTRMLDILFIYAKLNADLGYRQGMHELLAPVLWVIEHDAVDKKSMTTVDDAQDRVEELMMQTLDSDYIEHDAFTIFCSIMQTARLFYEHEAKKLPGGQIDVSPIVARSQHIHQVALRGVDPELADHLQITDILPQIFLTRWIRLLFGREFPFQEVLSIWDLLVAENLRLELIDAVCVAMLLRIRWQLLDADYSQALTLLLRYPAPTPYKPEAFVEDGLFLEQHPNCEGGSLLISKYSDKAPDPNKQLKVPSQHAVPRFPPRRKKHVSRDLSAPPSDAGSPALSPSKINQRRLDSLFQDVTEGLHRRTEGWGVTKVVRGAMVEARRNLQNIQSSASTPALRRPESAGNESPSPPHINFSTVRELSARISALENRNQALAGMLGDALSELRAQHEEPGKSNTQAIDLALAKAQFVQVYLEDPTMPIPEETTAAKEPLTTKQRKPTVEATVPPAATGKENQSRAPSKPPANDDQKSEKAPVPKTLPEPRVAEVANLVKPVPLRPATRAPLAESSFSWMLGDNKQRSSFVTSASAPPEQNRSPSSLFGDGRGDGRKKNEFEDEDEGVLLDRLRGLSPRR